MGVRGEDSILHWLGSSQPTQECLGLGPSSTSSFSFLLIHTHCAVPGNRWWLKYLSAFQIYVGSFPGFTLAQPQLSLFKINKNAFFFSKSMGNALIDGTNRLSLSLNKNTVFKKVTRKTAAEFWSKGKANLPWSQIN